MSDAIWRFGFGHAGPAPGCVKVRPSRAYDPDRIRLCRAGPGRLPGSGRAGRAEARLRQCRAAPGCDKERPGCAYGSRTGHGFAALDQVAFWDRGEPDAPKRDFGNAVDATFRLDVPNGNYVVSLLMGDWIAPVCTTLKTGAGRRAFRHRHVSAGQFARETFAVRSRTRRCGSPSRAQPPRERDRDRVGAAPDHTPSRRRLDYRWPAGGGLPLCRLGTSAFLLL